MANKSTILLIEDNQFNMAMARDLLHLAGFDTIEAEDADRGLQLAKALHPDLILMDMHLPVLDGYEATRRIKTMPETEKIPVVAFTALAMEDEQQKAFQSGCSGLISKPIDVDTFAQSVASYLLADMSGRLKIGKDTLKSESQSSSEPRSQACEAHDLQQNDLSERNAHLLQERERDLETFLYRVSHDLQSPLRKIRQFSKFLKEGAKTELTAENYQLLVALDRSAEQMYDLLSDLLQLARIQSAETNPGNFKLIQAVQAAMQINLSAIEALEAQFDLNQLDPELSIEGNYGQWVQLFSQLFQNSLKFHAPNNRPYIALESHSLANHPHWISLSIRDNGIGLRQDQADKIFEPMQRLHGVSKYSGTGLGLAIVKKIVDVHHGSIRVVSQPEQGATFVVEVPLKTENAIPSIPCQV